MAGALRELLAFFGVEVDDKAVHRADEGMHRLEETALKAGEILAEAFAIHEISEFISQQIELGARLSDTSEMLGIATGDLQAFEFAASLSGLATEEADTAMRFLNKTMGEALTGNAEAAKSFAALKVELKDIHGAARPVQDVLADVADGISKLPTTAQKTTAAMNIFGRAGARMIPLLNEGSAGIDKLYEEFVKLGGGMSEDFVKDAKEADDQIVKLKFAGKGLESVFTAQLLPSIVSAVDWLSEMVVNFRELTTHSYIVKTALGTLAGISAVLAVIWATMNIEVFLVIAALALLILAVDDIYTFFKGGDSITGRLLGDKADAVRDFFTKTLPDAFNDIKEKGGRIWDKIKENWPKVKDALDSAEVSFLRIYDAASKLVGEVMKLGGAGGLDVTIDKARALEAAIGFITGSIRIAAGALKMWSAWFDIISGQMKQITEGATAVVQAVTNITNSGDVSQHNQINNHFNIRQTGALSSARAFGGAIGGAMQPILNDAFRALPSGGGK